MLEHCNVARENFNYYINKLTQPVNLKRHFIIEAEVRRFQLDAVVGDRCNMKVTGAGVILGLYLRVRKIAFLVIKVINVSVLVTGALNYTDEQLGVLILGN